MYKKGQNIELLAPAGDLETLKIAIFAGADAVYISGKAFGARAYAKNFTNEEILEAVNFAHTYKKKVYITLNTIVFDEEYDELFTYLDFLVKAKIDAVIVQDLGIVKVINESFPSLELHASTQMNIFNEDGINKLKELNFTRCVLAREVSIDTVKELKDLGLELEVFIHGALCFCASGNCLMSSMIGGRSGNRGRCAQPCRKQYSLIEDNEMIIEDQALMSMKDLNTLQDIPRILDAGATSLKIEGRMKKPSYVYVVTNIYRQAIDAYKQNKQFNPTKEQIDDLFVVFNRMFTKGYLLNEQNSLVVNEKSVNHQGIVIGKVIESNSRICVVKLSKQLSLHDGIRFDSYDYGMLVTQMLVKNKIVKVASPQNIVTIPFNKLVKPGTTVLKTSSSVLDNLKYDNYEASYLKTSIDIVLSGKSGSKLTLNYVTEDNLKGSVSLDEELTISDKPNVLDSRIIEQLSKTAHTPFKVRKCKIVLSENLSFKISDLNELRRRMINALIEKRLSFQKVINNCVVKKENKTFTKDEFAFECVVTTTEQLDACKELGIKTIYSNFEEPFVISRLMDNDKKCKTIVSNLGQINSQSTVSNYLNIASANSLKAYESLGISNAYVSTELSLDRLLDINLEDINLNVGIVSYGKIDLMVSKHCIVGKAKGASDKLCNNCTKHQYAIEDQYQNTYPLILEKEANCTMRIINNTPLCTADYLKSLIDHGFNRCLLIFTDEDYELTKQVINFYRESLTKKQPIPFKYTLGSFKTNVE